MKITFLLGFLTLIFLTEPASAFKNNGCVNEGKVSLVRINEDIPPGLRLYICKKGENVDPTPRELVAIMRAAREQGKDVDKWAGILTANEITSYDELEKILLGDDVESISITNLHEGKFQRGQDGIVKMLEYIGKDMTFSAAVPSNAEGSSIIE